MGYQFENQSNFSSDSWISSSGAVGSVGMDEMVGEEVAETLNRRFLLHFEEIGDLGCFEKGR